MAFLAQQAKIFVTPPKESYTNFGSSGLCYLNIETDMRKIDGLNKDDRVGPDPDNFEVGFNE